MNNNIKTKIYCTYHEDNLIDEYFLDKLDTNIYELFNTKKYKNNLQFHICESVSHLSVLKEQPDIDVVGFCHYRRFFDLDRVDLNKVYNENAIYIYNIDGCNYMSLSELAEFSRSLENNIKNDFIDFLKNNNIKLKEDYSYYIENNCWPKTACSMYIARLDTCLYIENVIFSFLKFCCGDFETDIRVLDKYEERELAYALEQIRGFLVCNIDFNDNYIILNEHYKNYIYKITDGCDEEIEYIKSKYVEKLHEGIKQFYIILNNHNNIIDDHFRGWHHKYFYIFITFIQSENEINYTQDNIYIPIKNYNEN